MIVCLLVTVLFGGLFMALSASESSVAVTGEKVGLQGKARMLTDLVARDLRNAISWEMNANTPSSSYLKFNLWSWDTTANTWKLGNQFVEYSYDQAQRTLKRRIVDDTGFVLEERVFPEIMLAPFYTSYTDEFTNQFDSNALLANRLVIVVIKTQRTARGRNLDCTLKSEVKIRNG